MYFSVNFYLHASVRAYRILGPYAFPALSDMTHTVRARESRFIAHTGWFN